MKKIFNLVVAMTVMFACALTANGVERPRKDDVMDIIQSVNDYWQENNPGHGNWFWNRAVYHVGNMEAYRTTGRTDYMEFSRAWAEHNDWSGPKGDDTSLWSNDYGEWNVLFGDCQICFQVYSELYDVEKDDYRLNRAFQVMDYQVGTEPEDYIWWVDGMFMVMPVLTHLYKQTGNEVYLEKMHSYWLYTNSIMYDEETGLYFRDAKYVYPEHQTFAGKKDFWARGDGWAFATFARILAELPADHKYREEYVIYYRRMAKALAECQQPEGHWTRSILDPSYAPGYETSGTALMLYGYLWGINNGIFSEEEYGETVSAAWQYLSEVALQDNGLVGYIQPIGEKADPNQTVSRNSTADFGVGAYLLAVSEMYRYAVEPTEPRPLRLMNAKADDVQTIVLTFNDEVDETSAADVSHYAIDGYAVEAEVVADGKNVVLHLSAPLTYGGHTVSVKGLSGSKGGQMEGEASKDIYLTVALYPNENIVEATAIANQWGNPPAHVIDNSIDTRWSQDGLEQWINLELDTVRLVTAVDLAFYQGTVRFSYFDIQVSLDGYDFTTVLEGCSTSVLTNDLVRYYLPETMPARHVRIVCNGNSQGGANWNSITEARVVGEKFREEDTGISVPPADEASVGASLLSVDGKCIIPYTSLEALRKTTEILPDGIYILRSVYANGTTSVKKVVCQ
jgi:rhamnogalacturonyl hydrolase YesR